MREQRQRFSHHRLAGGLGRPVCWLLVSALVLLVTAGCANTQSATPVVLASPSALVNPPQVVPRDVLRQEVEIADGRFAEPRYDVQAGSIRLVVTTRGGPYTLAIPPLVPARQLPADATTEVAFTAPEPGEYTMRLEGQPDARALLSVRPVGGR